jgi:ribosomal protein L17
MTDLLRHESVHETLNNVPEMRQALAHAVSEGKKGNLEPYKQWLVVHETMANFQPPDFKGEKENVKNFIWNNPKFSHSDLHEEAQKVRQGGWKGE